ncbi:MAG: PKD domain-containing protein, partial [Verrucomicrobia bacterium]|nr:PKD domain-containing protein [Verrucomicrobiota bacterium]
MIKGSKLITCGVLLTTVATTLAAVHYVDVNSANPAPPYTNWATAATNIQDAVDAAVAGDQIAVTNGIYATGARTVDGYTTNRVAVNKPLSLRSINGPQFTTISGSGSVRCVYLTNGASLSGFTLTNGFARFDGGGLFSESANAVVSNCVLSGNSVYSSDGGGAFGCMLNNCILTGNSASDGGGAYWCTLNNCTLTGNSAEVVGGGAAGCTLSNCTLAGNSRYYGVIDCTLNNCIVYFNDGGNYYGCTLNYCCTTPLPTNGVGNISLDPQLASASHLSFSSPCRGAGNAAYVTGTDIDGEDWADPPSMGSDEFHASAVGGPLSAVIAASFTSVLTGFTVQLTALIEGRTTASSWDFGDGTKLTNQPYASHAWAALGDYPVVLHAFNESQPGGITATATVHVVAQPVHYVALGSANPVAPFSTWATAATNIQDAVNAATVAGALVLVTNGIYTTGGRTVYGTLINRVAVNKPLTLRSVNGPQYTIIQGYQVPGTTNGDGAIRCVYLTNGASLSGFTLSNGATRTSYDPAYRESSGGGLWCESTSGVLVSNCVVISNSASSYGGGACFTTL